MNEQLLLYLILEFEKDFKYFIQQSLIDLYTEELVLGRFENIVKIKRNSRPENKNKNSIDLDPIKNVYASIVHRASENSINAVMIGGKIVNGKL